MKRIQVARSWDFNQMLVASVSGHLLLITFVLFLPQTVNLEKVLPPAFMVELVEITQGEKKTARKPARKNQTPVPVKTEKAKTPEKPAPPKLIEPIEQSVKLPVKPKAPAVDTSSSDQILKSLDRLENPPTDLDKNFEQLAKQIPKPPVKPPVVEEKKPIEEKTFDESDAMENPLNQLASLDNTETLDPETPKKPDTNLKELEFASLTEYSDEPETKQDEKSSADLLKELTEMKQPDLANKEPTPEKPEEIKASDIAQEKSKVYDSILKKLDSLDTQPREIEKMVQVPEAVVQEYQSDIRKVSVPEQVQVDLVISPNQVYVASTLPGEPGADALALYKGMIIKKVMENWNAPLGQDHNKRVIISFNIFPLGNIDRPDLKKSSSVELLDNLALRAIRASEPFPKFPESLKSSNLNISIHFKYIQEKTKHDS
jgi:TonB family protein